MPKTDDASNAGRVDRDPLGTDQLINLLTDGEGDSVTFFSDNPDFNGLPNCCITVNGFWTEWIDQEFRADSRKQCLLNALDALRSAVQPHTADAPAPQAIMAYFGAIDAASYLYPGEDEGPLREAFCRGAAQQFASANSAPSLDEVRRESRRQAFDEAISILTKRLDRTSLDYQVVVRLCIFDLRATAAADPVRGEGEIRNATHSYLTPADPFPTVETAADRRRRGEGGA